MESPQKFFKSVYSPTLSRSNRRGFLLTTTVSLTGALAGSQAVPTVLAAGESMAPVQLTPRLDHQLFRVRVELDAKGNVDVPDNPLVSRQSKKKLPIESQAVFDYEERYRRPADADVTSVVTAAERFFHEAKRSSRLNRNEQQLSLRESVRQTIVRRESLPETIYATDDYFRHEEMELLRLPVSSVAVDRLLPMTAVRVGDSYTPDQETMVSLLNLSSVEASDVTVKVVSIDDEAAKLQFEGKVDGSVDGVPTQLRTIGKLTFDRRVQTCVWLTMAIHETREISKAVPGFDVSATIKMVRQPLQQVVALPAQPVELGLTEPVPQERLYIEQLSREVGVGMLMDRHWRMMGDAPGSAMLRMIANDRSIAQCDLRPLSTLEPGRQWTLEAFQSDVTRSLGKQLTQLIEADQRLGESGLRVLRVVAQGVVEGVPIQWIMLHFSDDSGRRVLATFTMDGSSIDEFAGSDVQLASTLRLLGADEIAAETTAVAVTSAPNSGQSAANVATNPNKDSSAEVQSASDLR